MIDALLYLRQKGLYLYYLLINHIDSHNPLTNIDVW